MTADPITISTEVAAVATVAYVFLTAFIWHATSQNTRATKTILEAAHRPYLGVMSVEVRQGDYMGSAGKLAASISNVGAVPSRDVKVDLRITYSDGAIDDRPSDGPFTALFPNQNLTVATEPGPERQAQLYAEGIEVVVSVRYKGIAGTEYETISVFKSQEGNDSVHGRFALTGGTFK